MEEDGDRDGEAGEEKAAAEQERRAAPCAASRDEGRDVREAEEEENALVLKARDRQSGRHSGERPSRGPAIEEGAAGGEKRSEAEDVGEPVMARKGP